MKIKMLCSVNTKINGLPGPFIVGVEYEMSEDNALRFVESGLAEYADPVPVAQIVPAPVYETTMLTDQDVIETPEDAVPQAFMRTPRWKN